MDVKSANVGYQLLFLRNISGQFPCCSMPPFLPPPFLLMILSIVSNYSQAKLRRQAGRLSLTDLRI